MPEKHPATGKHPLEALRPALERSASGRAIICIACHEPILNSDPLMHTGGVGYHHAGECAIRAMRGAWL